MAEKNGLTVALGGGGVKCFAQLGVLKLLEEENIPVRGLAATSGGAIIAAFYALGYPIREIRALLADLDLSRLFKATRQDKESLFGFKRVRPFLEQHFAGVTFSDLAIPLAFPAVDLHSNHILYFRTGPILEGLWATTAIPGIFPPQYRAGRKLIDGGVLAPVPVALARSLAPGHAVAAIVLNPPRERWDEHPFPQLIQTVPWLRLVSRLRFTRALGNYVQACDLTNRLMAELLLEKEKPEITIRPEVGQLGLFDMVDIDELMHRGEEAASRKMAAARSLAHSPASVSHA
jgi:NTE family protein